MAAVKTQRPIISNDEHVVLKFRPRTSAHPPSQQEESKSANATNTQFAASDLSRYERPRDEGDDFRHRMLANVAALAFTVALTAIGIWLAVSIADQHAVLGLAQIGDADGKPDADGGQRHGECERCDIGQHAMTEIVTLVARSLVA